MGGASAEAPQWREATGIVSLHEETPRHHRVFGSPVHLSFSSILSSKQYLSQRGLYM